MRMNKKFKMVCLSSVACAALFLGSIQAKSEENKFLTLRDAVAVGLLSNPEYASAASERLATDQRLEQGKALFLPVVDVNGDLGFEYTDNITTRAGTDDDTETLNRTQIGLTVTQLLFDGWESHYEVLRQKALVNSATERARDAAESVGAAIVSAYLDVLRQRQLLLISRDNVKQHKDFLVLVRDGVQAGRLTKADEEQVLARLSRAQTNESSSMQALRNAQSTYQRAVGSMAGDLELPVIPYDGLEQDVELEVIRALANNPQLDAFAAEIEAAYAQAKGTESAFYPQFDLQLSANNSDDVGGVEERDTSASALVVMRWNLYRGGGDVARTREFLHRHQQSKQARREAARSLEDNIRQTWARMVAASEQAQYLAEQSNANEEVVKAYKDQFDLGRRTLLDVLDAQNELFVTQSNTVNSEFTEMVAVYSLLSLKGQLLASLGVETPSEADLTGNEKWSYQRKQDAR